MLAGERTQPYEQPDRGVCRYFRGGGAATGTVRSAVVGQTLHDGLGRAAKIRRAVLVRRDVTLRVARHCFLCGASAKQTHFPLAKDQNLVLIRAREVLLWRRGYASAARCLTNLLQLFRIALHLCTFKRVGYNTALYY